MTKPWNLVMGQLINLTCSHLGGILNTVSLKMALHHYLTKLQGSQMMKIIQRNKHDIYMYERGEANKCLNSLSLSHIKASITERLQATCSMLYHKLHISDIPSYYHCLTLPPQTYPENITSLKAWWESSLLSMAYFISLLI